MTAIPKVSAFEVFLRMQQQDDNALKLAPMRNVLQAQATKHGTRVTMGVEGNVCGQILAGDFVGGLLLVDRKRFEEVRAQIEQEREMAI